jgi:hypothetical protein
VEDKDRNKLKRNPSSRTPERKLQDITADTPPAAGHLNLVHVTSAGFAKQILKDQKIVTRNCKVFGKDLVYLFLCHAAYRRKDWGDKSDNLSIFPAAFVMDPEKLGSPFHVYPFDTGAAVDGYYKDAGADSVYLEDYALSQDLEGARKFIAWAFGSIGGYLNRTLRDEEDLSKTYEQWDFVPARFIHIARQAAPGHNDNPDGRAAALEFAYDRHVSLPGSARCLIVPDALLENPTTGNQNLDLIKLARSCGVELKPYQWRPNDAPNWHMSQVEELCRKETER